MNIKGIAILLWVALYANTCTVQANGFITTSNLLTSNTNLNRDVQFEILLTNNVWSIGSTNTLFCSLRNSSTNIIGVLEMTSRGNTHVFISAILTNNLHTYKVLKDYDSNSSENAHMGIYSQNVNPGEIYRWSESAIIEQNFALGNFRLVANQIIVTPDLKEEVSVEAPSLDMTLVK